MKAAPRTLLLCIALTSCLAHAESLNVSADEGPNTLFQVVLGAAGELVVTIPLAYAGWEIGGRMDPPPSCGGPVVCDPRPPYGRYFGLAAGGFLGITLGAGLGVAAAGQLSGRPFHVWPSITGAAAGGCLALLASTALAYGTILVTLDASVLSAMYVLVPALTAVGALVGAIWWYEASIPTPAVNVTPSVMLVPGGGIAGIAGTF